MKNLIVLFALFFPFYSVVNGQVSQITSDMSRGTKPALTFTIPDANEKLVDDVWKEFAKDDFKGKAKYDRRSKEYYIEEAQIVGVGQGSAVNVYSKSNERGKSVEFMIWFDLGDSFLDQATHPSRFEAAESLLMRFGIAIQRRKVEIELSEQKDHLAQIEKELKKLEKAQENYLKDIEKAKEAIRQAEINIEKNKEEQALTRERIERQKQVVDEVAQKLRKI